MGTNFYFGKDEEVHIGKRSAAGPYCWGCGVSLCNKSFDNWENKELYGSDAVHYGEGGDDNWLKSCPICCKTAEDEGWNSAGGRELGFNELEPKRKTGVKSCSSFSWAISPKDFQKLFSSGKKVYDEYGQEFTQKEFKDILSECPIKYYHSVGKEFC
jgi:hypothetical protein